MLEIDYPDASGWYPFFDELKEIGMDTVIIVGIAGLLKNNGANMEDRFLITSGALERILKAAKEKGFDVYVGLVTIGANVNPAVGNSNDLNSDKGHLIDFSIRILQELRQLCVDKGLGWNDNFIKGIYIPQELPVNQFISNSGYFNYYVDVSRRLRTNVGINKKIILSPYLFESDTYQIIYDNILHAV
jgi:hypothetical protein